MFPAGGLVLVPLLLSAGLLREPGLELVPLLLSAGLLREPVLELVFTLEAGLGGLHPKENKQVIHICKEFVKKKKNRIKTLNVPFSSLNTSIN